MYLKQKEWSSFRITLTLYIIVLILPFSFYFVSTSFKTMQLDTKIVRQISWLGSELGYLAVNPANQSQKQSIERIDQALHEISLWVMQNNDSDLYIGGQTLSKDFLEVESCWASYKAKIETNGDARGQENTECWNLTDSLAVIIEKIVYLKQNKIINSFYLSLTFAIAFMLLMIYMVRLYIHEQIRKHAIYDHDTKLFNKQYFLAELKTTCARSVRNNYPLSMLSIVIDNFGAKDYDKKTQEHIWAMLGGLVTSLTRTSDVACRYDENCITILLADTKEEDALFLEGRIREALEKHDFGVSSKLGFKFATGHFKSGETPEAFVSRTQDLLKLNFKVGVKDRPKFQ